MSYDVLIKGGTVVDGSGSDRFQADVAINSDRIVAIGDNLGSAKRTVDAEGKLVTPGFVDIHTHLDAQIAWDPIASSSCFHGVTSVVLGNCGVTFAPCKPEDRDYLARLMESVEDIPANSIHADCPGTGRPMVNTLIRLRLWTKGLMLAVWWATVRFAITLWESDHWMKRLQRMKI